jgi:RNA polymerase sigma-70 factor, ECF subfamily
MTDADLVREFRNGNREAFSRLVERYARPLTTLILRMVGDPEEAKDISQTAFLKAYEGLPAFMSASSFKTWLYRIAINAARDSLRKRSPHSSPDALDEIAAKEESAGEQLQKARDLRKLREAVAELPEKQRLTLQLRVYESMDYRQIAKTLGGTEAGARGNFFQAIRALKNKLGVLE